MMRAIVVFYRMVEFLSSRFNSFVIFFSNNPLLTWKKTLHEIQCRTVERTTNCFLLKYRIEYGKKRIEQKDVIGESLKKGQV